MTSNFEQFSSNRNAQEQPVEPSNSEPTIIYVDVPDEDEPIIVNSATGAFGVAAMKEALRSGGDFTIPSLNIALRARVPESK